MKKQTGNVQSSLHYLSGNCKQWVSMMCKYTVRYTLCSSKWKLRLSWDTVRKIKREREKEKEETPTPLLLLPFLFSYERDVQTTQLRASGLTLWDVHFDKKQNNLKRNIKRTITMNKTTYANFSWCSKCVFGCSCHKCFQCVWDGNVRKW